MSYTFTIAGLPFEKSRLVSPQTCAMADITVLVQAKRAAFDDLNDGQPFVNKELEEKHKLE